MGWIPMDTHISSYLSHCESSASYPLLSALADDPAFLGGLTSFLLFTDYCIYWVHRWLHIPILYKTFHKPHHKWISECSDLKESARSVSADNSLFFNPLSPYPLCITCFSPRGWISSISPISLVHIHLPPSPATVLGSICCSELLEYFCTSGTLAPLFFGAKMNTDMSGCPRFMTLI